MEKNQLKEAISMLYDMELNNYLMTRCIQHLNYKISQLGYKRSFNKPQKREAYGDTESAGCWVGIGVILGAIIGCISGCSSEMGVFSSLDAGISGLFGGGFAGLFLGGIVGFIDFGVRKSNKEEKYTEEYEKEMQKYQNLVNEDNIRVKKELEFQAILIAERDKLAKKLEASEDKLREFYIRVGIDNDFKNLVAIGYMHKYSRLGITLVLEGENGLYDRVIKDLRADQLLDKLNELSYKLDTIIDQNNRIYGELMDINDKCNHIIKSTEDSAKLAVKNNKLLREAVENTRISAYNSERIAIEQRYQSMLMTWK